MDIDTTDLLTYLTYLWLIVLVLLAACLLQPIFRKRN